MCNSIICNKKYRDLKNKYNRLVCKMIVNKLKLGYAGYCTNDSVQLDFSIVINPQGVTYDTLIDTCFIPNLKKQLKSLHIFEE